MNEELKQKINMSIERLRAFEPKDGSGYYLAFSGGKDSVVVKALCDMAGVKYDAHYHVTSVDPPELVAFVRDYHPDVAREIPRDSEGKAITMWNLIPKKKMFPTRMARYCCEKLKEYGGDGRKTITGVRWAESTKRARNQGMVTLTRKSLSEEITKNDNFASTQMGGYILTNDNEDARRVLESCYKRSKVMVNPIIDWSDRNVWDFIHEFKIPYCKLYDEGFHRLGCIGCPMGTTNQRLGELRRWPKYKRAYRRAAEKLIAYYHAPDYKGVPRWDTVDELMEWWLELDIPTGQIGFDEIEEEENG